MTNLRKCLSVSTFAVLALAFCCLIIGQAAVAKVSSEQGVNADNSYVSSVPLPTPGSRIGQTGAMSRGATSVSVDEVAFGVAPLSMADIGKSRKVAGPSGSSGTKSNTGGEDPASATVIAALPYSDTGDLSAAASDYYPLDCDWGDPATGDLWYTYTPAANEYITISLCGLDPYDDFILGLYEDDGAGGLTYITCDEDGCVAPDWGASLISGQLVEAGQVYYIQIKGWYRGPYQIDVTVGGDPFEAACATADFTETEICGLASGGGRTNNGCYAPTGDLSTAEQMGEDPCGVTACGNLDLTDDGSGTASSGNTRDADVWRFTVTDVTVLYYTIYSEIAFATFLNTTTDGTCAGASLVGGTNWGVPSYYEFSLQVMLTPGEYNLALRANNQWMECDENPFGNAPRYFFTLECLPLTPIDDCPLPLEITGTTDGTPIVQDMCGLTTDGPPYPGDYGTVYGIMYHGNPWFLWTCEETGYYTFSACNTPNIGDPPYTYDLYMGIWMGIYGCPEDHDAEYAFNEDGDACTGWEPEITDVICAADQTYYITLGSWEASAYGTGACGEAWLDIIYQGPVPLIADNCLDEKIIIDTDHINEFFNNLNATLDGPDPSACNVGQFGGDIWFELQAWASGYAFVEFCEVNYDANLEVYVGGDCVNPTDPRDPIRCNDDGCWQSVEDWPPYHGSYTSFPVTMGESYLLRVGGWYNPPANPLAVGGMGFGFYSVFIEPDPPTVSPPNDFCVNTTPVVLVDGVTDVRPGTLAYATRNDMDCDMDMFPPNLMPGTWEPFTVPAGACMFVSLDHFGYTDPNTPGTRYGFDGSEQYAYIGCPCDGDFIPVQTTRSCLNGSAGANACAPAVPGGDFNGYHEFSMLPAGDYFFYINHDGHGSSSYWFDYSLNINGTAIECAYCAAASNAAACPPVAGASYIMGVTLAEMTKVGIPDPGDGSHPDCNQYEDHTVEATLGYVAPAELYKGLPYTLNMVYFKQGTAFQYDLCRAWVDWNQNSAFFEPDESYPMSRVAYTWSATITPPFTAIEHGMGASGECRLRISLGSTADGTTTSYCGGRTWGEVEDFVVMAMDLECGDFDGDDDVDADDIAFLQAAYFAGEFPEGTIWQRADMDNDGEITLADLVLLADYAYGRVMSVTCIS